MMIALSREYRCRVHIVHLSSADAADLIAQARRAGLPITAETCPHYLTFAAEDIRDGETHFKCAPPIRERVNRDRLWSALAAGTIDMVVSDHSPCSPELKKGDFASAWGGIASLQFTLPAVWTEARKRGHTIADVARWTSEAPSRLASLDRKGTIVPGKDADLVVWNPDAAFVVENVLHRHALTPYRGRTLTGVVEQTYVRGERRL
jgi:allantoinase